ncbi:MAG: 2OG-Fe(II) oxygenase [Alphaproteobacteria bacterium]
MTTDVTVSPEDLLLRPKKPEVQTEHFPFFVLDDFVGPELYARLVEEFPRPDEMRAKIENGKRLVNNRQLDDDGSKDAFFADKPTWKAVIDILGSELFVGDLEALLRPHLVRHRLLGAFRKWRLDGVKVPLIDRSVQLTYEWSCMVPGEYLNPHTDKVAKMATFVWHFPEPGWKDEFDGSTLFMTAKRARHNINWANFKLPFEELDVVLKSEARANRLVMFAKTGNSWHAVPPIECDPGVNRRVFIFNYRYPVEVANSFSTRAIESFHRRSQGWLFKDFPEVNRKPGM